MRYRPFGRSGLEVSVVGIGTGGASRLGLAYGNTQEQAIAVVQRGFDLGINYFDTAENYKNEEVLGKALLGHRNEVLISSKVGPLREDGSLLTGEELYTAVELSLRKLQTDVIDVFHLHRVSNRIYDYCAETLVPALEHLRDDGKIRLIALSESSGSDIEHTMLKRAVEDDCWDVFMASFNLFNQSARESLFSTSIEKSMAVEIMASARSQFSQPDLLIAEVERLVETGEIPADQVDRADPLSFLRTDDGQLSPSETSYRFAAFEPGVNVVLVGTGNIAHLEENVAAFDRGPLPEDLQTRLVTIFGHLRAEVHVPGREEGPI